MSKKKVYRCIFCYNELDEFSYQYNTPEGTCDDCETDYDDLQGALATIREIQNRIPPKIYNQIVKQIQLSEVDEKLTLKR